MLTSEEFFRLVIERPDPPPGPLAAWRQWWTVEASAAPALARSAFVLTAREADGLGFTRSARRTALRRNRWVRVGRGFVAPVDVSRDLPAAGGSHVRARRAHALTAAGAARARPNDVIAGRSAAILHGMPTLWVPDRPELLAGPVGGGVRRPHHIYLAGLDDDEIGTWYGAAVTRLARTLVDLGRHNIFDAIMAVDAALREHLVTPAAIGVALAHARGWPGVRNARRVLELGDPRAESPLESITRLRIIDDGLPLPDLQVWIGPWRVDFFWPDYGLVLEADGRVKYEDGERWEEKQREHSLRRLGVERVERVTMHDVLGGWPVTSDLLHSILR